MGTAEWAFSRPHPYPRGAIAMPLLLLPLFVGMALLELYVLIQVGQAIGGLATIALLIVMSIVGATLLRREGRRTWQALRAAMAAGRLPAREVADGVLVVIGGALILAPGFVTDVIGLLMILPASRPAFRGLLTGLLTRRLGLIGLAGHAVRHARRQSAVRPDPPRTVRDGNVVEGDVIEGDVIEGEIVDEGA